MKKFTKFLAVAMALGLSLSTFASCVVPEGESSVDPYADGVTIDETKTQLFVYNYNGGFGRDWLYDVIKRFETQFADYQGANGKVGVQIVPDTFDKTLGTTFIKNPGNNDVFFTEDVFYYDWVNENKMYDLTTALTTPLTEYGETRSVFDKLSATQQSFYKTPDNKVMAVPYRTNAEGIIYDVELFNEESLYLKEGGGYTNLAGPRAKGPDNTPGTDDDGLPATYDQFFDLCDVMVGKGITPFTWTGASRGGYLGNFLQQLIVDYEGLAGFNTYMNYSGTANHLVKSIDEDGNVTFEDPTVITEENGYLMSKSAGRYYGLQFFERLIANSDYYADGAFSLTYKHTQAQEDFLRGKYETTRYAFLIDGIWWENEAKAVFEDMAEDDEVDSRLNRQFKLMQLPKPTNADVGKSATVCDNLTGLCFVNGNIPEERKDLAEKFVRFCFTDESNIQFNLLTGMPRAMGYTLNETQLGQLSMFGKSLYTLFSNQSAVAYPYANTRIFRVHSSNRDAALGTGGKFVVSGGTIFDSFKYQASSHTAISIFNASKNALQDALPGEFGN